MLSAHHCNPVKVFNVHPNNTLMASMDMGIMLQFRIRFTFEEGQIFLEA